MMMILKKTIYQSTNKEIFNELIKERRKTMHELHSSVNLIVYYIITKILLKIKILVCIMTQTVFLI